MAYLVTGGSLIQSSYRINGARVFDAVVYWAPDHQHLDPGMHNKLQHFRRVTSHPDLAWDGRSIICTGAQDAGCIIETKSGSFEVVVPYEDGLANFTSIDNSTSDVSWTTSPTMIAENTAGPASLVQNWKNDNLEVVVRQGGGLRHYWRDGSGWHRGAIVTPAATGPACLIQSTYWGNLDLVVLEGTKLVHYWRDESEAPVLKWRFGAVITNKATGPAGFIQGRDGISPNTNFHVVVPEGDRLIHYWRDNTDGNLPWYWGGVVTHRSGPVNAACLAISAGLTPPADYDLSLEVLAQENGGSIYHYYRYPETFGHRWFRSYGIRVTERDVGGVDADLCRPQSEKIAQLTGQFDAQLGQPTFNKTLDLYGIRGTDLGASFRHRGRIYFLFGDTHWREDLSDTLPGNLDCIAYTELMTVVKGGTPSLPLKVGLPLKFHRSHLKIVGLEDRQANYDVPLDGFSFEGEMFVFFTTDHFSARKVMGRSVLTRCLDHVLDFDSSVPADPLPFHCLTNFSSWRFINVSVERVGVEEIEAFQLPASTDGLLIWGTGAYRADDVYLAFLPLDDPNTVGNLFREDSFPVGQLGLRYFEKTPQGVAWSYREEDAWPLFPPTAIGELSVRWNPVLRRWVCMYCAGPWDRINFCVYMRTAKKPWGPWSRRRLVFHWKLDGQGRRSGVPGPGWFIHFADKNTTTDDGLGDDIIDRRGFKEGGGYAPYQLPYHTELIEGVAVLYYVLSLWNPYQVVLMEHRMSLKELDRLEMETPLPLLVEGDS